jgi:CRP-like cAMP-binding protein
LIFEELKNIERQPNGAPVAAEDLLQLPVFKDVSPQFLKKNANATIWRHFKRGEIVCREGEFGSTAFYILEGTASVQLASPIAHVKAQGGPGGFFGRLTSKLTSRLAARQDDRREEDVDRRSIPIDAPVDLAYDHPVAELGPGELFGEMTCMNYYPRSATVRAETDCTMLEMLRNVLARARRIAALRAGPGHLQAGRSRR